MWQIMADQNAETKPKVENGNVINLVVKDQNDTEVRLRISSIGDYFLASANSVDHRRYVVVQHPAANADLQVHFKVKTHTKFQKIMEAYAAKRSVDVAAIRFLYDGQRLAPNLTPGMFPTMSMHAALVHSAKQLDAGS